MIMPNIPLLSYKDALHNLEHLITSIYNGDLFWADSLRRTFNESLYSILSRHIEEGMNKDVEGFCKLFYSKIEGKDMEDHQEMSLSMPFFLNHWFGKSVRIFCKSCPQWKKMDSL